jgi:voltage-gated potassium channel
MRAVPQESSRPSRVRPPRARVVSLRPQGTDRGVLDTIDRVMNHVATEIVVATLIVASVALLVVEATLLPSDAEHTLVAELNDVITWVFVVELALKFLGEQTKRRFVRRYWLDIIAVLPLMRGFRLLRILRLLRLFRLGMILSQHAAQFSSVFRTVKLEYVLGGVMVLVAVLMGALTLRMAEADGLRTFEESLWYALMTLAAGEPVGGEPTTRLGRVMTLSLMLGGMTIFAFFAGTVSAVMIDSLRKLRFKHMELDELEDHVIVCGWNISGSVFLEELMSDARKRHVVIITEKNSLDEADFGAHASFVHVIQDDFTRTAALRRAVVERASFVVILADEGNGERSTQDRDARTVLAAMLVERMNPAIHTTVQLLNRENEVSLREAGVEDIIISDEYVGSMMANVVKNRGMVPVIAEILTSRYGQQLFKVDAPASVHGMRAVEAMRVLKEMHDATLLAVEVDEDGFEVNPPADFVIEPHHRLVITARAPIA